MSAHFKGLLIAASLLATLTVLNAVFVHRTEASLALGLIGVGLIGVAVGFALRPRPAPPVEAVIAFAQELMASTTMDRFRRAVSNNLPMLLGTRRVWIATQLRRGRQVIVPETPDGTPPEDLLDGDGRDWTTFELRVGSDDVGVLGIESSSGVKPHVRRVIQTVAPMIAQAMTTAHAVDTMRETSLVDLLTGLATRREGMTRFETEIKRAQRSGATMAVLMLDLDQFKSINDRFGHAAGDAVLGAVGRTIMRTLRASDIRVRWGGEEFLIVLPETDLPRAQVVANGLLREIASATVATPNGPTGSTISIGITISHAGETDAAAMIRRADAALYHAKAAGRACVRVVLADRSGQPAAESPRQVPPPGSAVTHAAGHTQRSTSVPFSERRNPDRSDRRRIPSPGRRSTDLTQAPVRTRESDAAAIPSMPS
jgi:diguanylate cyclase (GGDEF)-like protein